MFLQPWNLRQQPKSLQSWYKLALSCQFLLNLTDSIRHSSVHSPFGWLSFRTAPEFDRFDFSGPRAAMATQPPDVCFTRARAPIPPSVSSHKEARVVQRARTKSVLHSRRSRDRSAILVVLVGPAEKLFSFMRPITVALLFGVACFVH